MKISEVAKINTGLVLARKKSAINEGFIYKLLTLKSFNQYGYIEDEYLDKFVAEEKIKEQYLTKEGDVIVRLSFPNVAIHIDIEHENIVIPSLFVVIKATSNKVLAEFVQIYINSDKCKKHLLSETFGSAVSIVKASTFKELHIPIYKNEEQTKIIDLNKLMIKEKKLLNKLVEEKEKYHKNIINNILK
ncbi:restriction endonuclease subunit S [Clostridium gasigenes]|uniref:Restriction endonuclease subunit S n=1 Tax=Clostridium gasigenes TaxID=94869 RepID=A0A7X0VRB9_9CLOT|nr:restriction endonuclease subunit S [Clostridium gasigenes]MBB6713401.1 restriction endonuclease subunit S [Clostridium gasigenes]